MSRQVSDMMSELDQDRKYRDDEFTRIEKHLNVECQRLRDEINEEQRARTEATDSLYNKLTETVKSL